MENSIWNQQYSTILISIKRCGIVWELWSEQYVIGDGQNEFFNKIKAKYRTKFKGKEFQMRLYYPNRSYTINHETTIN